MKITMGVEQPVCSICREPAGSVQEFAVDAPQVGRRLIFKACPNCQAIAETHTLCICLGCKALTWEKSDKYTPKGINHVVKSKCPKCALELIRQAFTVPV